MELSPEKKMSKARINLIINDPFFGTLSMDLKMRPMEKWEVDKEMAQYGFATAWVDGVELVYSKRYVDGLSLSQCKGLVVHEVIHVALKHHLRRGSRDYMKWQFACDYAVDPILIDAGYDVPDASTDPRYDNKSVERIYALLPDGQGKSPQNRQNQGQQQLKPGKTIVKDAPINLHDKKEIQKLESKIDMRVLQAVKSVGYLPGSMSRVVKLQQQHRVDEWDILREFMERSVMNEDYSWKRPNRRYSESEICIPGFDKSYEKLNIIVCVDKSGSVSEKELQVYSNKISGVLQEFDCSFTVIFGDTEVRRTQELNSEDMPIKLECKAGGGTKFRPFFDHIREKDIDSEAIMFFTDMCAFDWSKLENPGLPTLWMNTNRSKDNFKPPFGTVVAINT